MKKAWAIDIHGILNTLPEFYAMQMASMIKDGWEIHVLTGSHLVEKHIKEDLAASGIRMGEHFTHIFSISDYHTMINTEGMYHDNDGNPWISDEEWDRTKAEYCYRHQIPFCIDDTARYAKHFKEGTAFGYTSIQVSPKQPNKYLNLIIDMFEKRRNDKKNEPPKNQESNNRNLFSFGKLIKNFKNWTTNELSFWLCPPDKLGKEK